jgi:hypothetical protein
VYVYLPQETIEVRRRDTVQVPILITNQTGQGIISADITLTFPESLLTGTSLSRNGNAVPSGWMTYANPFSGEVLIAMAGADPLVGGDTLLVLKLVADSLDGFARIGFTRCDLNEGNVPCSTGYGQIQVPVAESPPMPLASTELRVWPNPTRGEVDIEYQRPMARDPVLEVRDAAGSLVRRLVGPGSTRGGYRVQWDGRNEQGWRAPPGVYFCRLRVGSEVLAQKLIVE